MFKYCEWLGCLSGARQADAEYREWHPDDKRPIYCDSHCAATDNGVKPRCECGTRAVDYCFMCRDPLCYTHKRKLFPTSPQTLAVYRCPRCAERRWDRFVDHLDREWKVRWSSINRTIRPR